MKKIRAFDLFCGAGGSSIGASQAGANVVGALDMWKIAKETYKANFPNAHFFRGKARSYRPSQVRAKVGRIDLLIASPACTSHSVARGSRKKEIDSLRTALEVTRFAATMNPRWIIVENVQRMTQWAGFNRWHRKLEGLGYKVKTQVLNAADFGVPQSRRRLFVICDKVSEPPEITPSSRVKRKHARGAICMNGRYPLSPLFTENRAKATKKRARAAIKVVGERRPFILVYYGSDGAGGWQRLEAPLRTITTLDRFALVRTIGGVHSMRMLQAPELQDAMGFPVRYKLKTRVRREKIGLLGNAVCPPVMKAIVKALTKPSRRRSSGHATKGS